MEKRQTLEGKLKILSSTNKYLYPVEIWALNEKVNRNNWQYTRIAERLELFRNIPILIAYEAGGAVVGSGHNFNLRRDKDGEEYASFTAADAERIVGWVHDKANIRIEKDEEGTDWVVMDSYLWSWYSKEAVDAIASEQGRGMSVSIETLVTEEHMEGDVAVEDEYVVLGITILGAGVQPAVESARIKSLSELSEMREVMHDNVLKAASYIEGKTSETVQEKTNTKKEVTNLTYFSRKQCAELSKRFDGYTVIVAAQDDKCIHVAMLSDNGDIARYDMNSADETIAVERIRVCDGTVTFDCDNCDNAEDNCDNTLSVGLSEAMEAMNEVVSKANEAREKAEEDLRKANESITAAMGTIADMRNAENARRVQSAKETAKRTLSAFNANSAFEVSESVLEAINNDIDSGVYTERVNSDGAWVGDAEVELRVKALCADEQQKFNQANAEKNKKTFIWEKLSEQEDDGSIGALLKRKGIRE